jgi:hypothetical protein
MHRDRAQGHIGGVGDRGDRGGAVAVRGEQFECGLFDSRTGALLPALLTVADVGIDVTMIEPRGYSTDWLATSATRSPEEPAYEALRRALDRG